ncbi:MAG: hypothetical protein ACYDEX_21940 [Mobilitalea sp.]
MNKAEKIRSQYVIYIDSDCVYRFSNKRKAEDFKTQIEKSLTDTLVFINEEYCACVETYRHMYFVIGTYESHKNIGDSMEFIRNKIAYVLFRTGGQNRNSLVALGIESMLFELISVYKQLEELSISRNDTVIRHKIATKYRIINYFLKDFREFEKQLRDKIIEVEFKENYKLKAVY